MPLSTFVTPQSSVAQGAAELYVYGTAVRVQKRWQEDVMELLIFLSLIVIGYVSGKIVETRALPLNYHARARPFWIFRQSR